MSEIKNINKYEETNGTVEKKNVEVTPYEQLKNTVSDAKDKAILGVNKAVSWTVENPKKAVAVAGSALAVYNTLIRPVARDISKYKKEHTYEFYDFKNHERLLLRRKLTDRERKELTLYLNDRSEWHFASDWLRARHLLK